MLLPPHGGLAPLTYHQQVVDEEINKDSYFIAKIEIGHSYFSELY